jgi:YfiH family protein
MVGWTGKRHGDLADASGTDPEVAARRQSVVARPWTWLTQVHGAAVAVVQAPGGSAGQTADASVSAVPGVALAILTADCAPVAFASPEGVIAVAHAGWRGLVAGVIDETVSAMRALGARSIVAALGPCIHAECYAFGPDDLTIAADLFGSAVRAETAEGRPALDIPRAVQVALDLAGAPMVVDAGICTSCSPDHWSWRARHDRQRQATVVWLP